MFDYCGETYYRSACWICPYSTISGTHSEIAAKFRMHPEEGGYAAFVGYVAQCLNPRQTLYPRGKTVVDLCIEHNLSEALIDFYDRMMNSYWTIYHVRRIYSQRVKDGRLIKNVERSVEAFYTNSDRIRCSLKLQHIALTLRIPLVKEAGGTERIYIESLPVTIKSRSKKSKELISKVERENFLVLAPHTMDGKKLDSFDENWEASFKQQLSTF
jgi:hypothetical protein